MTPPRDWPSELLVYSAARREELCAQLGEQARQAARRPLAQLADEQSRTPLGPLRLALVATSNAELADLLGRAATLLADPHRATIRDPRGLYFSAEPLAARRRLAFVFPGDGSPYLNMVADLRAWFPQVSSFLELADQVAAEQGRIPTTEIIFPSHVETVRERRRVEHRLRRLENSGAAVLACNHGLYTMLRWLGVEPAVLIGHSLGDWSALAAGGTTSIERFLRGVEQTILLPGHVTRVGARMALVIARREVVEEVLQRVGGEVYVAMHNGPTRLVVAGAKEPMRQALAELAARGIAVYRLPFVRAAHTPMSAAIVEPLRAAVGDWCRAVPGKETWSCITARPYPNELEAVRELMIQNMVSPVEFVQTVERAWESGIRMFVECGAGGQLADCVGDILGDRPHLAGAVDVRQRHGITQLNHLLAALVAEGVDPRFDRLREVRGLSSTVASNGPALCNADAAAAASRFVSDAAAAMATHSTTLRATLASSQRFTTQFMTTQREVMAAWLAATPQASAPSPSPAPAPAFLSQVAVVQPGAAVEARWALDPSLPYLADHAMGGFIPAAAEALGPLPLVPLTISVEVMAEAAALLFPGLPLISAAEIVARRPVAAEGSPTMLVRARLAAPGLATVEVVDEDQSVYAEGKFGFGHHDGAPPAGPFELADARAPALSGPELYTQRVMFHGPCYHGVARLEQLGADGICGALRSLPRAMLFGATQEPELLTDPALLDAMGQMFGYWPLESLDENVVVFPTHLSRIDFYDDPPRPGQEIETRIRLVDQGTKRLVGDIDLVREGRVIVRVSGWRFWRFNWPLPLVRFTRYPNREFATTALGGSFGGLDLPGVASALVVQPNPLELLPFLVRSVFTRAEHERFLRYPETGRRREEFFLGRLAAKEAVRRWAAPAPLYPSLLEVTSEGPPAVGGREIEALGRRPHLSLAHVEGAAAAVAADFPLGLDLERVAPRGTDFVELSFAPEERSNLVDDAALTAAWVAKEAAAKLVGSGLSDPRAWRLTHAGLERATVTAPDGRAITVRLAVAGDLVAGLALIPPAG